MSCPCLKLQLILEISGQQIATPSIFGAQHRAQQLIERVAHLKGVSYRSVGSHEVRGQAPARSLDLRQSADRDHAELLLYSENCVLCHLGDSEFEHGFGGNSDFLLRLGIRTRARLPLLFDQLAKAGQNEFARLFDRFVSEGTERIEEYSSGLLIGLGGFQQERGEVLFWSSLESFMTAASDAFKEIVPPLLHPTPPVVTHWFQ